MRSGLVRIKVAKVTGVNGGFVAHLSEYFLKNQEPRFGEWIGCSAIVRSFDRSIVPEVIPTRPCRLSVLSDHQQVIVAPLARKRMSQSNDRTGVPRQSSL